MKTPHSYITVVVSFIIAATLGCVPSMLSGRVSSAVYEPHPGNATFFVVQSDKITLTERKIQNLIVNEMEKLGFRRTANRASADFYVVYSYSIGSGTTHVSSSPDFVFGGQEVTSSVRYPRYFHVAIVDARETLDPKEPVILWQAELYSSGSSANISELAETFVSELFKRYGKNVKNEGFMTICP